MRSQMRGSREFRSRAAAHEVENEQDRNRHADQPEEDPAGLAGSGFQSRLGSMGFHTRLSSHSSCRFRVASFLSNNLNETPCKTVEVVEAVSHRDRDFPSPKK